jgi:hypothetical protein
MTHQPCSLKLTHHPCVLKLTHRPCGLKLTHQPRGPKLTYQPCGLIPIRWRQARNVKTMDLKWMITKDRSTEYKGSRTSRLLYVTRCFFLFASSFKCKQSSHTHTRARAHNDASTHFGYMMLSKCDLIPLTLVRLHLT